MTQPSRFSTYGKLEKIPLEREEARYAFALPGMYYEKVFCSLLMILLYREQVKKKCFLNEKFLKEK